MKPTSLLSFLTTSEQRLSGLRSLLIVTPKSFSWLTLESSEPFIIYFVYWLLILLCKSLHLLTLNFTSHFFDQMTNVSRFDWNCSLSAVVVILLVIFVSLANFDILRVRLSSISLIWITKRMVSNTEPCGTPLITSRQLDDLPFITTLCFLSESQSSNHLSIFPDMPCDYRFCLVIKLIHRYKSQGDSLSKSVCSGSHVEYY